MVINLSTPPSNCSTPKSQYSDDSLSQDYSPSLDIDVGWDSKKRPGARRRRATSSKFAEALAKEKLERNPLWRRPLLKKEDPKPGELSALEKFKLGIKQLESGEAPSPKSSLKSKTFTKQKENVTRSFIFGGSDDSDDEAYASWNSMLKKFDDLKETKLKTPNPSASDDSWRKTKSENQLNASTKTVISEPLKDLFDDSVSDSLLYQCTQQVEKKLANETTPEPPVKSVLPDIVNDELDNDSFDEMLSSFPLEEIVQKSEEGTKSGTSFQRHSSMPCQSKITSIVETVNSLVERHHTAHHHASKEKK